MCGTMGTMHTHFGSATSGFAAFLSVLIFGTFWRIGWLRLMSAFKTNRTVQGLGRMALFQFG